MNSKKAQNRRKNGLKKYFEKRQYVLYFCCSVCDILRSEKREKQIIPDQTKKEKICCTFVVVDMLN